MFKPPKLSRFAIGLTIIGALLTGIWLLWPTITYDMDRMFLWQRIFFWAGDVCVVVVVLQWMMQGEVDRQGTGRSVAISLVLSLLVDIGVTGASMSSSYAGLQRAVSTEAEVEAISESFFNESRHLRFDITYTDQNRRRIETYLSLVDSRGPADGWKDHPLTVAEEHVDASLLSVMHDPKLPTRVWFNRQDFGSTSDVATLFAVIHIFQVIVVFSVCGELIFKPNNVTKDATSLQLLPLAIEALGLCLLGFLIHQV